MGAAEKFVIFYLIVKINDNGIVPHIIRKKIGNRKFLCRSISDSEYSFLPRVFYLESAWKIRTKNKAET